MAPRGKKRSGSRSRRSSSGYESKKQYTNMTNAWLWFNLIMAGIYLALAIVSWIWLTSMDSKHAGTKMDPVWVEVVPWADKSKTSPEPQLANEVRLQPKDFRVFFLIMFLVAASAHIFKAVDPSGLYSSFITSGGNWLKWFENFIAMPIMVAIIASFASVYTVSGIAALVVLVVVYSLVSSLMEFLGTWHMKNRDMGNVVQALGGMSMALPLILSVLFVAIWGYIIYSWSDVVYNDDRSGSYEFPAWITILVFSAFAVSLWHYAVCIMWYFGYGTTWRNNFLHELYHFFWRIGVPLVVLFGWSTEISG